MANPAVAPILDKIVTVPLSGRNGRSVMTLIQPATTEQFYIDCQQLIMDRNMTSTPNPPDPALDMIFPSMGFRLDAFGLSQSVAGIELRFAGAISTGTDAVQPTWSQLTTLYLTPGSAMVLQDYHVPCNWIRVQLANQGAVAALVEYGAWVRPL